MKRSWLAAALTASGYAALSILLSMVLVRGAPHPHDLVLAGGLYTLTFAARLSI